MIGCCVEFVLIISEGDINCVLFFEIGGLGIFVICLCEVFFVGECDFLVYFFKDLLIVVLELFVIVVML